MVDRTWPSEDDLHIDQARRVDAVCRQFETDWRDGRRPRIEDYLTGVTEDVRQALRFELDALARELNRSDETSGGVDSAARTDQGRQTGPDPPASNEEPTTDRLSPCAPPVLGATARGIHDDDTMPAGESGMARDQAAVPAPEPGSPSLIRYFGDYEILGDLSRGGMGVVYLARQRSLGRLVALKMILAGQLANDTEVQRFYTEAEAAAGLDHPGIVPIFEVGQHQGQHYFSMGFVDGQSLSARLAAGPLATREAAAILVSVAEAIAYAHARGVIHRDLKPGNILLDRSGNPRVVDFGLAKKLEASDGPTVSGQIMGTPSFMPPEQAAGRLAEIGPASDIYSLGATLYAMITGRPPFQASSAIDTVLQVLENEPVPPRRLNSSIPRDLETICLKCLEKSPARRYASATDLARDLERFLDGRPIIARRVSPAERAWKWAARRPALSGTLALCAALLVAASVGGTWFTLRLRSVNRQLVGANQNLRNANDKTLEANRELAAANREATRRRDEARHNLYAADMDRALHAWEDGRIARTLELLGAHAGPFLEGEDDLRGFDWHYLRRACDGAQRIILAGSPLENVAISPDGTTIAATTTIAAGTILGAAATARDRRGEVLMWDARTGSALPSLLGRSAPIAAIAYRPDGKILAARSTDGTIHLWDLASGRLRSAIKVTARPAGGSGLAFSPDGRRLACGEQGGATIWDVQSDEPRKLIDLKIVGLNPRLHALQALTFTPDGKTLIGGDLAMAANLGLEARQRIGGSVSIWDVQTGRQIVTRDNPTGAVRSLALLGDGKSLVVAGMQGVVLWNTTLTGQPTRLGFGDILINGAAAQPGGRLIGVIEAGVARLWDMDTSTAVATLRGHRAWVTGLAFFPDGKSLATLGRDGIVRIWNARAEEPARALKGSDNLATFVAFSPDGKTVLSAAADRTIRLWDFESGRMIRSVAAATVPHATAAFRPPDGRQFAAPATHAPGQRPRIQVWETDTGRPAMPLIDGHDNHVTALAYSPDGRLLASAGMDRRICIRDASTGAEVRTITTGEFTYSLAFHPEGQTLASGSQRGSIHLWEIRSGREVQALEGHERSVSCVVFSPDGRLLASTCSDHTVRIWDVPAGKSVHVLKGDSYQLSSMAFSRDGKRLATGGLDRAVRVWDVASGQETLALKGHAGWVYSVAFSPDGRHLASVGGEIFRPGEILIWDGSPPADESVLAPRVEDLFRSCLLKQDVLERLERDASLTAAQRSAAARLVSGLAEDPGALLDTAWKTVRTPGATAEDLEVARRHAFAADRLDPDNPAVLGTLGALHYRMARYREALAELNRSVQLGEAQSTSPGPCVLAFLAMSQHRLGQTSLARETLERTRALWKSDPRYNRAEIRALVDESSALIEPASGGENRPADGARNVPKS